MICKCSHTEKDHMWSNFVRSYLGICVHNYAGDKNYLCQIYRRDNLKYLEKLYENNNRKKLPL